ncbi:MAG: hypothetical protein SV775_13400 [Thermodesulfobacteriota bacterium]|nr:hypothetical protein [Thermodesulfobacteriota bacterium]
MRSLNLGDLKPGMVLAKPVHSLQGALLTNEGKELSEKDIWIFKSWGVTKVWVEGEDEGQKEKDIERENDPKALIQRELEEKFAEVSEDRVMKEIMRIAYEQLHKRS